MQKYISLRLLWIQIQFRCRFRSGCFNVWGRNKVRLGSGTVPIGKKIFCPFKIYIIIIILNAFMWVLPLKSWTDLENIRYLLQISKFYANILWNILLKSRTFSLDWNGCTRKSCNDYQWALNKEMFETTTLLSFYKKSEIVLSILRSTTYWSLTLICMNSRYVLNLKEHECL